MGRVWTGVAGPQRAGDVTAEPRQGITGDTYGRLWFDNMVMSKVPSPTG